MGVVAGQSTLLTFSVYVVVHYFILGLNFIFFCYWVWYCMIVSLREKEIKFKPMIKLNHNIYVKPNPALPLFCFNFKT